MSVQKFYKLAKKDLFPLCRSLTGDGVRKTLKVIRKSHPSLKIYSIKSKSKVFDWLVPPEWIIKDAFILDKYKNKIVNFKNNNLHLVGYSIPVNKYVSKKELFKHLHTLPKQKMAIPYITSYYKKYWGFCVSHKDKISINKKYNHTDKFKVVINSKFNLKGVMNYGELIIPGESRQEILISTNICHPSMANNELSGPIVSMCLIEYFKKLKKLKKTIRFVFIPETIGSITFLNKNLSYLKNNVIAGYNLVCIGDDRRHSCMLTKYGNTISDKALIESYKKLKINYKKYSFLNRGSDERQYNSPGIDLPIASIFRSKYEEYPEYHTSLDNFDLVTEKGIRGGFRVAKKAIEIIQKKTIPQNKFLCEPHMSKRGLYPTIKIQKDFPKNIMDFLQYSDGKHDLKDLSKLIKVNLTKVSKIYRFLLKRKIIK